MAAAPLLTTVARLAHTQTRVRRVRCYATFKDMIEDVGITDLLPGFKGSLQDAVDLYHSFGNQRGSVIIAELEP